ncbi:response regulator transcription factor [Synechococcus sp. MIT S1220]|uniref:response regulator transcription factor n=1 Tax=Synechococcus sp. MIT S1220 TaxID=3082549 RepID=UPI0039B080AE
MTWEFMPLMKQGGRTLTIAVVEDNPRIRELLQEEIVDEGHIVLAYATAEDFLGSFESDQAIDLVLMDLMLPGMDGISCLKQLQQEGKIQPCPRVVIVTALNDNEKRSEALSLGADDYVLKPDLFHRLPEILQAQMNY